MGVFISYSNHDKEAVRALTTDLGRARQAVWLDQELYGGDTWWETILQQIRDAEVFVLALSNNSERSKPCRAELEYARTLGIPVVPVQIGPLDRLRSGAIADLQIVDYRSRNADAAIALIGALHEATARRGPLPEPLPDPPPIPFEYLMRLGRAIDSSHMQPLEQVGVLAQLRQGLDDEDDVGAQRDIAVLLQNMRRRPDVTYHSVKEIDTLLATIDAAPPTEPDRAQNSGNFHRQRPKNQAPPQALVDPPATKNEFPKSFLPKPDRPPTLSIAAIAANALAFFIGPHGVITILFLLLNLPGIICGVVAIVRKEKLGVTSLLFVLAVVVFGGILPRVF